MLSLLDIRRIRSALGNGDGFDIFLFLRCFVLQPVARAPRLPRMAGGSSLRASTNQNALTVPGGQGRSPGLRGAPASVVLAGGCARRGRTRRGRQTSSWRGAQRIRTERGRDPLWGGQVPALEAVRVELGWLCVRALNVNGIRIDRRRRAVGSCIAGLELQPDVCTHEPA